jgi:hypothetical protein
MKFEDAGRAVDREVAKLADYLDKQLKPSTRTEMASLLRRASEHLTKLANSLEKEEPGPGGQKPAEQDGEKPV